MKTVYYVTGFIGSAFESLWVRADNAQEAGTIAHRATGMRNMQYANMGQTVDIGTEAAYASDNGLGMIGN